MGRGPTADLVQLADFNFFRFRVLEVIVARSAGVKRGLFLVAHCVAPRVCAIRSEARDHR